VVVFVHNLVDNGVIGNSGVKTTFDILYWLFPHQLVSSAAGDLARAQIAISGPTAQDSSQALASIPPASGVGDILWWILVVGFFTAMLYYAVRRRQV